MRTKLSSVALWLFLHRITCPIWLGGALYKVQAGEYLNALLVVCIWLVVHFILMTLNARDLAWIREGEQMRLQAERDQREQEQRNWEQDQRNRWSQWTDEDGSP